MQNLLKLLAAIAILLGLVFGYFLYKSNWDMTLATGMIKYEVDQRMGKAKPVTDTLSDETHAEATTEETETAPQTTEPAQPAHSKDSIYKDKGNSFSDIKRTGNESNYEPK